MNHNGKAVSTKLKFVFAPNQRDKYLFRLNLQPPPPPSSFDSTPNCFVNMLGGMNLVGAAAVRYGNNRLF